MAKLSIDLSDDEHTLRTPKALDKLTAKLPSVSKAKSGALKDAPRVQFAFSNVPRPIKEAFAAEAVKRGISQKEMLYVCLRAGGLEIPAYDQIDGRRR